ncbi:MAG: PfkB family carbohydrate kinase [Gaiellaceae bacterium]
MRVAVVGHVEWVHFARVERLPSPGEIIHASEHWEEAGGGGAVAALQLAALAGEATIYTALGDDECGHRAGWELCERGVRVAAVYRDEPQRRAFTFVDAAAERTITLLGPKLTPRGDDALPWEALDDFDGVYYTAREAGALRQARRARTLVATARELTTLLEAGVELDALVHSGQDAGERYEGGVLDPPPRLLVTTAGRSGGTYRTAEGALGTFPAAPLPGAPVDAYGAGDCFAAGLTFALAHGEPLEEALALAARCGAGALSGPGVHVTAPP